MSVDKQPQAQDALDEMAKQLLNTVKQSMGTAEVEQVAQAIQLAQEKCAGIREHSKASLEPLRLISPLEHALAIATILAQMHIDAVGIAAGVIFEAVDADLLSLERVEATLGSPVARVVGSIATRRSGASAKLYGASRQRLCVKCSSVWRMTRVWCCSSSLIVYTPCA